MAFLHIEEKHLSSACNPTPLSSQSKLEASSVPEQMTPSNTPGCMLLIFSQHFTTCGITLESLPLDKFE